MFENKAWTYLSEEPSQVELPKSKGRLLALLTHIKSTQNLVGDKHYSLFVWNVIDEEKKF